MQHDSCSHPAHRLASRVVVIRLAKTMPCTDFQVRLALRQQSHLCPPPNGNSCAGTMLQLQ